MDEKRGKEGMEKENEEYWTFSTEWSLKKRQSHIRDCPLAAMKRQKPKLQLQLRGEGGGGERARARCTRNYSDDNATLRMHPKRTDEASEFQKPLLTEIRCGESRSRFFIRLFYFFFFFF